MEFADLKNDFVFRRIFASHPDILIGLLNDLLERSGKEMIQDVVYLPSEQLPAVEGGKLSILDVRCRDFEGNTFVVEMQLLHHQGFINRVVYNACRAYSSQMKQGDSYKNLTDVVAISICDFELWRDEEQDRQGLPRVPMLSRWNMTERSSKAPGLLHVQYAFLELPKLPEQKPEVAGPALWAWLFAHGHDLTEIPSSLPKGPYRAALNLANQATFTQLEMDAYRKVHDEIQQVFEIVAEREGIAEAKGEAKGMAKGKAEALLELIADRGLAISADARVRIESCRDLPTLRLWMKRALTVASAEDLFAP